MTSKRIGPELPPGLKTQSASDDDLRAENCGDDESAAPAIGPILPPHLQKSSKSSPETQPSTSASSERVSTTIGPALPPHLAHLAAKNDCGSDLQSSESNSSDEDGQIGPAVALQGGEYDARKEFTDRERRAEESKDAVPERESWMTELPSDRTGVKIGLGARMFTKREGKETVLDDSWTAIPGQEKQKPKNDKKMEQNQQDLAQRKRDAEIDEHLEKFNAAKRSKSLIEMHKEAKDAKLKKKAKKDKKMKKKDKKHKKDKKKKSKKKKSDDSSDDDDAPPVRKPFNWEEDMRVSMVDTTRAKSMLDKTLLQSRFAPGKSQKYL